MTTRKEQVFKLYEKTINILDDMTEYRELTSNTVKSVLEDMYKELELINSHGK